MDNKSSLVQVMAIQQQAITRTMKNNIYAYGTIRTQWFNSLSPGRYGCNLRSVTCSNYNNIVLIVHGPKWIKYPLNTFKRFIGSFSGKQDKNPLKYTSS